MLAFLPSRLIWINVIYSTCGQSSFGPWAHYDMMLILGEGTYRVGFTWFPKESPFLRAFRRRLLALAVNRAPQLSLN